MSWVVWPEEGQARRVMGAKARLLAELMEAGLRVPPWFVVPPQAFYASLSDEQEADLARAARGDLARPVSLTFRVVGEVAQDLAEAIRRLGADPVAVRPSAAEEEGSEHSFAGQFEQYLGVAAEPGAVAHAVARVWASGFSERVRAYRAERELDPVPRAPAVIVQRMLRSDFAGAAFSADPESGWRGVAVVTVSRVPGAFAASGEAETWRFGRGGEVLDRKPIVENAGGGLGEMQAREVATLARACERFLGRPQEIEWAFEQGRLWLLQSRPLTVIAGMPDPDGERAVWEHGMVAEAFGGATTALTFSLTRRFCEAACREFCRALSVPEARIEANHAAFGRIVGFIRNRIYFNLSVGYRVLGLFPGFEANRAFVEQMLGLHDLFPEHALETVRAGDGTAGVVGRRALWPVVRTLLGHHRRMPAMIREFLRRVDRALESAAVPIEQMRPDELTAHFWALDRDLLQRWDVPVVNDCLARVLTRLLRCLTERWCGDADGSLANALLAGHEGFPAAEPVAHLWELARIAAEDSALRDGLGRLPPVRLRGAMAANGRFSKAFEDFLQRFGDRCVEELKLESRTMREDPSVLLAAVGELARNAGEAGGEHPTVRATVSAASRRIRRRLGWHPLRGLMFAWVLRHARARLWDRERLRFERSRVFGRVREIAIELGRRLHAARVLADPREVFDLDWSELLGFVEGTAASAELRALAAVRQREYERHRSGPVPDGRFETRGMVLHGHRYRSRRPVATGMNPDDSRRGLGVSAGVVRGRARVVAEPTASGLCRGEILVAERADASWVILFPVAAGLVVEGAGVQSHVSVVARELGLPAVVGLPGVIEWIRTGDEIEIDGASGEVRKLTAWKGAGVLAG